MGSSVRSIMTPPSVMVGMVNSPSGTHRTVQILLMMRPMLASVFLDQQGRECRGQLLRHVRILP
jgi:hypothetical protein